MANNKKKYDEIDIASVSTLENSGFRLNLKKNVAKAKEIGFQNLSINKFSFQLSLAKSLGKDEKTGFNKYGWKKDEGAIYIKLSLLDARAFANAFEQYALYGEECIYERPIKDYKTKKTELLDKPGFSMYSGGTDNSKTLRITLNTSHWKSKNPERSIAIIATEKENGSKVSLSLPMPKALALAQECKMLCDLANKLEFDLQLSFTNSGKVKQKNVGLDETDDEEDSNVNSSTQDQQDDPTETDEFDDFDD